MKIKQGEPAPEPWGHITRTIQSLKGEQYIEIDEPEAQKKARSIVERGRQLGIRLSWRKIEEDKYRIWRLDG